MTKYSFVVTATRNSPLVGVNKNFMQAADLPILPVVVQSVEPLANRLVDHTDEVEISAIEKLVLCTRPLVPVVEKKPLFPFSHARIDRCIVAIATNHARVGVTPVDRAGKHDVPDYRKPPYPF